jgi:DNA-binding NarL/FixJ family response regulator
MATHRTIAVVSSPHAVIEGVLRLTAASLPGIDRVVPASDRTRLSVDIGENRVAIAVIDLDPTPSEAIELIRSLGRLGGDVPVVLITDRVNGAVALEAVRAGARGLLLKPDALHDLNHVLRRILAGERVVDPALDEASLSTLGRVARRARADSRGALSPREMEVLVLMGDGLTMQQIARRLGISPRTVEAHATKLYRKLDVRSRVQAVAKAATMGLIELS